MTRHSAAIAVMVRAARAAARHLVRDFNEVEHLQVSVKGPGDFVSAADRRAEGIIHAELERARPDYGFLMEETGVVEGRSPHNRWIVDPLDGTTNFLHATPHWAISIALEQHGDITAAVIYDPIKDELFSAVKGGGAFVNDRRIRVSKRSELDRALIGCGLPVQDWEARRKGFPSQLEKVADHVSGLRRYGACSLDLAYVAAGRLDGYWEYGVKPWDYAAGLLLVREAAGRMGRLEGDEEMWERGTIVAGNPEIYGKLRGLLAEVTPGGKVE
ncbi:inositol monophosphatase family protein [Marinimicrococcus flavescens]|uniref:Inositol-1-monophosphatase n=1 Tax=Marinimicrococcus flavescens TaxID=3031815 RepID=A0AAP4D530_9PROT|nr:inositol monophosphatase family protein [Marinimicrococcus flavescens]